MTIMQFSSGKTVSHPKTVEIKRITFRRKLSYWALLFVFFHFKKLGDAEWLSEGTPAECLAFSRSGKRVHKLRVGRPALSAAPPNDKRVSSHHDFARRRVVTNHQRQVSAVRAAAATCGGGRLRPARRCRHAFPVLDNRCPSTIRRLRRPRQKIARAHPQTRAVNHAHPHAPSP